MDALIPLLGHVLLGIVAIGGMFLILIAPHEFGHMAVAQLTKIRVYEFSVGFGPKLLQTKRGGTEYTLRLLPIGGYVRMAGQEPGDYNAPGAFGTRPAWARLSTLLAGPAANVVVAMIVVACIGFTQLNSDPGLVASVTAGSPAAQAGLHPGDSIRTVNGRPVQSGDAIRQEEQKDPSHPLTLQVVRPDGTAFQTTVRPQYNKTDKAYLIGITEQGVVTPVDAVRSGVLFPWTATQAIVTSIAMVVTGSVPGGLLGPNGLTGPVGVGDVAYQAAADGFAVWLTLAALLSMSVALFNLLPVPALDGGRILVVLLEKVRGQAFDPAREAAVQRAGFIAVLALVLLVALFDVQRIASGSFPQLR
ncbi:MAG: site-2 protease family protein [Candidatus Dormibacteraeota bacterium]|nr:site-2 protease family protein [Candidatus Dormibacteraeota bacterium]